MLLSNVDRNEGRLWATGWQGQMTAYVKHETSNCGACVNDAIYLFYSIFFMSLSRQILDKTIYLGKEIYFDKMISLTLTFFFVNSEKRKQKRILKTYIVNMREYDLIFNYPSIYDIDSNIH